MSPLFISPFPVFLSEFSPPFLLCYDDDMFEGKKYGSISFVTPVFKAFHIILVEISLEKCNRIFLSSFSMKGCWQKADTSLFCIPCKTYAAAAAAILSSSNPLH
jgi:hypothetical protein